jgi:hypothetical protein
MLWSFDSFDNSEMKSYFKSEYKQDWQVAYCNFLESRKSENIIFKTFKKLKSFAFPTEQDIYEKELSKSTDHYDLERRQKMLDSRFQRVGLVS